MRVLIAGGGTGGHVYPGITIAQELAASQADVLFVGTKKGLEAEIVPRYGFAFAAVSSRYIKRTLSPAIFATCGSAARGVFDAAAIIRNYKPDVVVGMGGYVAGPVLLAAATMRVPTLIHEQNAFAGVTNRLLGRFVRQIALGYPEAAKFFPAKKVTVTGNPVRRDINSYTRLEGRRAFGLHAERKLLLVAPGSQGARRINQAMLEAAPTFHARTDLQVMQMTGRSQFAEVCAQMVDRGGQGSPEGQCCRWGNYLVVPYIHDMPHAYAAADLLVGRGGALSAAEITMRGLPALLIPYPFAAENHQLFNAQVLEKHGAARVLLDKDVTGESLSSTVLEMLDAPQTLALMRQNSKKLAKPDATQKIVSIIRKLGRETE